MPSELPASKCSLPVINAICIKVGDYYVTSQPVYNNIATQNPYQAIGQAGVKSVLSVRDPMEVTSPANPFDLTEAEQCVLNNVGYTNVPLPHVPMTQQQFNVQAYNAATVIDEWTKPLLIHCSSGDRASAAFAVYLFAYKGWTNKKAIAYAQKPLALKNAQFIAYVTNFSKP
jgi:protein tyrosine phosphatase (PTP) superfamily phosphohydrolase (DUF442 family)